jgi:putative hemolysin
MNRSFAAGIPPRPVSASPRAGVVARLMERALGMRRLDELRSRIGEQPDLETCVRRCLELLGVGFAVPEGDLGRIPDRGPLLAVANRPFGALDGLLALHLLQTVRPDVKVLADAGLGMLGALRPALIEVEPRGGEAAVRRNARALRAALRWLEDGHALVVFPAGEVARRRYGEGLVHDPVWNEAVGWLVRRSTAPVLPIYFGGDNGRLFDLAGRVHPRLRTALWPRALLDKAGCTVRVRIGRVIGSDSIARFDEDRELVDYLRLRTMVLGRRLGESGSRPAPGPSLGVAQLRPEPLVDAVAPELLAAEVAALPPEARMSAGGGLETFLASAQQIPQLLREIGRLRERTFRAVGEGTGRAIDLDRFDQDYLHLFLWRPERREVIGAYRLGPTDRLLARGGLGALYTSTLFEMDQDFVERVTPGLELGRSFVRQEDQRSFLPLLLLWRGISTFVARNPRYRRVFGPVSISAAYGELSRVLMVEHLREHEFLPEFAASVRPRRPLPTAGSAHRGLSWTPSMLKDLGEVSAMVAEMEEDAKGVPVLIREYLKLGGKIVGFNVDPAFANVVDGLVLVDLAETEPRLLARYMGAEAAAAFLAQTTP